MKKLLILFIAAAFAAVPFTAVSADVANNPNSFMVYSTCGETNSWVIVPINHSSASFSMLDGSVGVMKAMYINVNTDADPVWQTLWSVPGSGLENITTFCTWWMEGMQYGGDLIFPKK